MKFFIIIILISSCPVARSAYPDDVQSFGVIVLHQPIVMDDNIITSWNPSTAIDVALLLLEHLTSKNNADKIRQLMGFNSK